MGKPAIQLLVVAALLAIWVIGGATGLFNPDVMPPASSVAYDIIALWTRPEFVPALLGTLTDSLLGVIFAAVIAIPLGLLIGIFPLLERTTRIVLDFGRSFPVVALLPIFVLIIGANATMKVVTIAIACFFPILLQTIYGARRLEPTVVDTVRSFRIPFHLRFYRVILPAALPYTATGLRIAMSVSVLVAVGTEVLIPVTGLGQEISLARINNQVSIAFAYVIYAGILGVLLTGAWELIEDRILPWSRRSDEA